MKAKDKQEYKRNGEIFKANNEKDRKWLRCSCGNKIKSKDHICRKAKK